MIYKNKKYWIIFFIVFFIFVIVHRVSASNLKITEIMYNSDGTDIDWLEIYNSGSDISDFTTYKLLVGDTTESNHSINSYSSSKSLSSGDYIVIVPTSSVDAFISKWGNSVDIFTSSFSLPNSKDGENIEVSINTGDKSLPITSTVYNSTYGANGNGNSLQLMDDVWEESSPTPGEENIAADNSSDTSQNTDGSDDLSSSTSSSSSSNTSSDTIKVYPITTKIIVPKTVIAGVPFTVDHETFGTHKEPIIIGKFIWNFGDGVTKAVKISDPFQYVYEYPGDYVITLSFYDSVLKSKPDASNRLNIKVISSGVTISSVGDYNDPYFELENTSNYEVNLYGWIIRGNTHSFIIPEGTIILPNKKLKFSPRVTGFDYTDLTGITLTNEIGEIFATYPKSKVAISKSGSGSASTGVSSANSYQVLSDISSEKNPPEQIINLNDLGASAESSKEGNSISSKTLAYIGLAIIIILGIVSVIFLKKPKEYKDYVEGDLSADDMKILE